MPGGVVGGPEDDPGDAQDGQLASGEIGQQAILPLDVGGDAHPAVVRPGPPEAAHSPTPAARALMPL